MFYYNLSKATIVKFSQNYVLHFFLPLKTLQIILVTMKRISFAEISFLKRWVNVYFVISNDMYLTVVCREIAYNLPEISRVEFS